MMIFRQSYHHSSLLFVAVTVFFTFIRISYSCKNCDVQNLRGDADYRAVKLSWRYLESQEPPAFRVKYCEISGQSRARCRQKVYPLSRAVNGKGKWLQKNVPPTQYLGKLIRIEKGSYQTSVLDLRMLTNYSFAVEADFYGFPYIVGHQGSSSPYHPNPNEKFPVSVETRGFSGKTILCLGNMSEVAVSTGPYFNGKISVEGAPDEECSLYGNRSSSRDLYTIKINHTKCLSRVNNSRIETMIIVHENKEILTHNSRRFLVVCNFQNAENFTLTASVDVPPHLLKRKKLQPAPSSPDLLTPPKSRPTSDDNPAHHNPHLHNSRDDANHIGVHENFKFNHVRDSRILALQGSHRIINSDHNHSDDDLLTHQHKQDSHYVTSTGCFFLGVIGFTLILWIIAKKTDSKIEKKLKTNQAKDSNHHSGFRIKNQLHQPSSSSTSTVSTLSQSDFSYDANHTCRKHHNHVSTSSSFISSPPFHVYV